MSAFERLNWAESPPTGVASGRPDSAPEPSFRCEYEIAFRRSSAVARFFAFQMAEVAIANTLFADM